MQDIDYDHPFRSRPDRWRPYCIGLLAVAAAGMLWVTLGLVRFATIRLRSTSQPGVVVGYEMAGGRERLRIENRKQGRPAGYVLVSSEAGWPRFSSGQAVEVLIWSDTNPLGQRIRQTTVYAAWNFWARYLLVLSGCAAAATVGFLGLRRGRGRRPPPLPAPNG